MLPQNKPDRIRILFDDHRLVANAGLLLPATLARHLGLRELVDHHLDLGGAPGRANTGDKMLTLVASALAGGDCIDDADALRAGGTVGVLGCVVKALSTLGTFLRSFRWGHLRQLDRVSRQLLARAWAAGAGPGDSPLSIDLDSTICETYGLAKEGARHHGYTGARGYHPLLAIAAGTGEVLMSRLREGRANTARGAAHFLRQTVGRVRYGGARGQLTVRADSGFYAHTVVAACREMDVRLLYHHPPARQPAGPDRGDTRGGLDSHSLLDGRRRRCRRDDLHPVPDQAGRPAGPAHCPAGEADARFPARPLRQIQLSRLHHRPRWGETLELEADHRRHAEVENAIRDLKYGVGLNHMPSARFAANGADWSGRADRDHQDPQAAGLRSGGADHPLGAPPHFASPPALVALGNPVQSRLGPAASHSVPGLTASLQTDPTSPQSRATPVARVPCCVSSRHPAHRNSRIGP